LDRMFWSYISFQRNKAGEVTGFIWKDPDEYAASRISKAK